MRPMTAVYMRESDSSEGLPSLLHGMHIMAVRIGVWDQPLSGTIPKLQCLEVVMKSTYLHLRQIFEVKSSFSEPFYEGNDECCSIIVQFREGKGHLRLTQVGGGGARKVGERGCQMARWPKLLTRRASDVEEGEPTPCHLQLLTATNGQSLPRWPGSGSAGSSLELLPVLA